MFIFVDESGPFVPTGDLRSSMSCVAALVVPELVHSRLLKKFDELLAEWGHSDPEVKGRELDETRVSQVIDVLCRFDVILKVCALDIGLHHNDEITAHKNQQADKISENLRPEYNPRLVEQLTKLSSRIRALSNQLYAESVVLTEAIDSVVRTVTLDYAFRLPEELGAFQWIIDAKDRNLTEYEELWRLLIAPWLQSNSLREPLIQIEEGDYSSFARFEKPDLPEPPPHLEPAVRHKTEKFQSVDVKKLMLEHLEFSDSVSSRGLQLADICANAFRRACNSKLKRRGWRNLGRLMVKDLRNDKAVSLAAFSDAAAKRGNQTRTAAWDVLKEAEAKARDFDPHTRS